MDVGSHTRTHADLTTLNATEAMEKIAGSKRELEHSLNCEVRHFCYPHGRFDATHCQMVRQAGYVTATTTRRDRVQLGDDPYTLRRVLVAQASTPVQFAWKIVSSDEDRRG